ncbi:TniQ family protein [Paraburkholderia sediminicola]|uniref:TniQ family protein n=1 Tax=Paraburkholderia sediminicola TaxID=458836 RepID=UPI0038BD4309
MNTYFNSGLPLCRPKVLPDEWVETYLFRVARANGIRHPRLNDTERFRPTLPATALSKPDGYPIWSATTLPRWSVVTRVNKIRYCPECMTQSRYIRSRWRLTVFDVCTIHDIRLKDDLVEPVMTRGYRQENRYFVTDVTDEQLWAGAVCPMPSERRHVDRLWSGFERSIVEDDTPGAFEQLTCILFLEALLDALASTTSEFESSPVGIPRSTKLAELVARYEFSLSADLDGIRNFLGQITLIPHRDVVLARLRRMLLEEAHRPTCFSNLPIAVLRRRLLVGAEENTHASNHGLLHPGQAQTAGRLSFERAKSLIGCPPRVLRHLIDNKVCQGASIVQYGSRRNTYISPDAVHACTEWYASIATPEQVMNELGIDQSGFLALFSARLLRPIAVDLRRFFKRSDLTDICRRLEEVSRPSPANAPNLHPLLGEWIPSSGPYRPAALQVLREAFSGKLPIFRQTESSHLFAYFVDYTALERARRLRKGDIARHKHQKCSSHQASLLLE